MTTIPTTPNGSPFSAFNLKECFDATLALLNNWRQHSGLPIMKAWLASDPGDSKSCLLANALSVISLDPTHRLYERTSEHVAVYYDGGYHSGGYHGGVYYDPPVNGITIDFPASAQAESFTKWANEYVGASADNHAFRQGSEASNRVYGPAWMAVIAIAFDNKHPDLNEDLFRGEQYVNDLGDGEFKIPTHITAIEPNTGSGQSATA